MRSLTTGLLTIMVSGFFGMAAIVGCSADGSSDDMVDQSGTDPEDQGAQLPPSLGGGSSSEGSSSGGSTSSKDGGKKDAAKDSGPPPPEPGDPCPKVDEIISRGCGKCGKQEALCEADADGGTGGKVSEFGACHDEVGLCEPGESRTTACGNCGTKTETCNNYCAWSSTACTGEPANSCSPGTVEYTTASCAANTYKDRTCGDACTWSAFSSTCAEPKNANVLNISGTLNGTATKTYTLSAAKQGKRQPTYTCGGAISSTSDYAYDIVEIRNNTAKTATVKVVWPKSEFRVTIAAYDTNLPPQTDAELKDCTEADYNYSTYDGEITGVKLPPNAHYLLRLTSYWPLSNTTYTTTGSTTVTVTTTNLQ